MGGCCGRTGTNPTTNTQNGRPTTDLELRPTQHPVKLLWQKSPGGGPLVINADGSLSISNVPASIVTNLWSYDTIDSSGDIGLCITVTVETSGSNPSPSDLWRNIVKYIEKPPGTVVAIQSQLHDKLFLMGFPTRRQQTVYGEEPDGGFKVDTHAWWRPVVVDRSKKIILLQYYGENYQYLPDDRRSLYLVIESCESEPGASGTCNFSLRPRVYAITDGRFQWGGVA